MPSTDYTVSAAAAAARLGVSLSTLGRWADAGLIPHLRTPGGWRRFRAADVEQFASSLEPRTPEPETAG